MTRERLTFEQTMAVGARQYQDVLEALTALGLPARFTQTGGMNAAIEITLEAGRTLLVTDAEDTLSWSREEHRGWAVGLYPPDSAYDEGPLAFDTVEEGDLQALVELVDRVLRQPGRAG